MGRILLFYKYIDIENPHDVMAWLRTLCTSLSMRGRILLAHEGINATVGGTLEQTEMYKKIMLNHPLFKDIDFKESEGDAHSFPRLMIKVRKEIVTLGIDPEKLSYKAAGKRLSPKEAHELIASSNDDLVVLDARNQSESRIGTFKNAITPPITQFKQLPQFIDENVDTFKGKKVLMFCTGGIRCERASAYVKSKGIDEVYHINGGIQRYTEQFPDGFFRGKNYVFDSRVTVKINEETLGTCEICNTSYDEYANCLNASCNKHFICCPDCMKKLNNTCSVQCQTLLATNQVAQRPPIVKRYE